MLQRVCRRVGSSSSLRRRRGPRNRDTLTTPLSCKRICFYKPVSKAQVTKGNSAYLTISFRSDLYFSFRTEVAIGHSLNGVVNDVAWFKIKGSDLNVQRGVAIRNVEPDF